MNAKFWLPALLLPLLSPALRGQQTLESEFRLAGPAVTSAFEEQRQVLQTSSAVIQDGREQRAYGVVMTPEGHLLTKASEIADASSLNVIIDRQRFDEVEVLAVDPEWDVALLKVDASDLVPVVLAEGAELPQGTWVVANGATSRANRRALAGVISANTRAIPPAGGLAMGVTLRFDEEIVGLVVEALTESGGAARAGLVEGDVIVAVDGKAVTTVEEIGEILQEKAAGSTALVRYRRDEIDEEVAVPLTARGELFDDQLTRNDMMSGLFSPRRSGFARVIQHDILGARSVTGGPLLDLDGRCVGMNIARANRCESFAIPAEDLREVFGRLMAEHGE